MLLKSFHELKSDESRDVLSKEGSMLAILYGNQGNVGNSNKRIVSNLGPSGLEGLLFHCPTVPSLAPCWVPPLPLTAIGPKVVKLGLSRCALSNCDRLHQ